MLLLDKGKIIKLTNRTFLPKFHINMHIHFYKEIVIFQSTRYAGTYVGTSMVVFMELIFFFLIKPTSSGKNK